MKLTESQAAGVFDILVEKGNFGQKNAMYLQYKRDEFIYNATRQDLNEYWYESACGSSIKVYFDGYSKNPIRLHPQTFNPSKEATLASDANEAFDSFVATENAKVQVAA